MAYDEINNFAITTVATAPSPAASGTSLVVASGDGSKFPTAPFNAVIWPVNSQPTSTNAEIVRVTAVSTDTLTITRQAEGTSARTVVVGDQIMLGITKKTIAELQRNAPSDGWVAAYKQDGTAETWTYASATTFTVSGDLTTKYYKGVKIKFTQTSAKYFYVTASSHADGTTTVTVTGGSDYSVANAAITSPYYSLADKPQGFPNAFNYSVTWSSTGASQPAIGNGTLTGSFSIANGYVTAVVTLFCGSTTTYGDPYWKFSVPVTSAGPGQMFGQANDSGTAEYPVYITISNGTTAPTVSGITPSATGSVYSAFPMTWTENDSLNMVYTYPM